MKKTKLLLLLSALALLILSGCSAPASAAGEKEPPQQDCVLVMPENASGEDKAEQGEPADGKLEQPQTPVQDTEKNTAEQGDKAEQPQQKPAEKPKENSTKPVDKKPQETAPPEQKPAAPSVTFSISCATINSNTDLISEDKKELVPSDGWLLSEQTVEITADESVFDVLQRIVKDNKLHMEFVKTPAYKSAYIEGIGNLYEFDCGPLSGWMYRVNGEFPGFGCSLYKLKDGDKVEFVYTCDLGADVGGSFAEQNSER